MVVVEGRRNRSNWEVGKVCDVKSERFFYAKFGAVEKSESENSLRDSGWMVGTCASDTWRLMGRSGPLIIILQLCSWLMR